MKLGTATKLDFKTLVPVKNIKKIPKVSKVADKTNNKSRKSNGKMGFSNV